MTSTKPVAIPSASTVGCCMGATCTPRYVDAPTWLGGLVSAKPVGSARTMNVADDRQAAERILALRREVEVLGRQVAQEEARQEMATRRLAEVEAELREASFDLDADLAGQLDAKAAEATALLASARQDLEALGG